MKHLLRLYEAFAKANMKHRTIVQHEAKRAVKNSCTEGVLHSRRLLHFSCAVRHASFVSVPLAACNCIHIDTLGVVCFQAH